MTLDDVDAVLALAIEHGDKVKPWAGAEAIAVRAITALSRYGTAGNHQAQAQARELIADLLLETGRDWPMIMPDMPHAFNAGDPEGHLVDVAEVDLCDDCGMHRRSHPLS